MEEENKEQEINNLKDMVKSKLNQYTIDDINTQNLEDLYKLVDIEKDLENIEYWELKKEVLKDELRKLW